MNLQENQPDDVIGQLNLDGAINSSDLDGGLSTTEHLTTTPGRATNRDKKIIMESQKAIELLEKSEHIAILLPPAPPTDSLAAAEVLAQILTLRQKEIGFLGPIKKEKLSKPELFPKIAEAKSLLREFIISIDTSDSPISQLRYEKGEQKIDVILSPKNSLLKKESVSFNEGRLQCDCAVMLGIADPESLTINLAELDFFTNTPILNIDFSSENKKYGEVNLLNTEKMSLSEIIYSLTSALDPTPLDADKATLLLAGIIDGTRSFSAPKTSADTLLTASELMRLGAKHALAQEICKETLPLSLAQLFGRSSIRSKIDENAKIVWSFVTADDYEKTGRSPADIPAVLSNLQKTLPSSRALVLLSQQPDDKSVSAFLAGEHEMLEAVRSRESAEFQSPHLRLNNVFSTFHEAEDYLTSLIKELL